MVKVRVSFNNFHISRKFRTASYLAMQHIWHDNNIDINRTTIALTDLGRVACADVLTVSVTPLTVELTDGAAQTRLILLLVAVGFHVVYTGC